MLKQDAVLERLMPALDLTLGLWVIGGATDVLHFLVIQPLREIRRSPSVEVRVASLWARKSGLFIRRAWSDPPVHPPSAAAEVMS
jgi:hypothetical protein